MIAAVRDPGSTNDYADGDVTAGRSGKGSGAGWDYG